MSDDLIVFEQRNVLGKEFKIYGDSENPIFMAKEVANWIEYDESSVHKLVAMVEETEKVRKNVPTLGGNQEMWFLTEDGLYEVLFQSRKPIAKEFKKQVKEILKEIRKRGIYVTDVALENMLSSPDFGIRLLSEIKFLRVQNIWYVKYWGGGQFTKAGIPDILA
jgi:prophage antirepressor-like protein